MKRVLLLSLAVIGFGWAATTGLRAIQPPQLPSLPDFDKRLTGSATVRAAETMAARTEAVARLRERVPGVRVDMDGFFSSPKFVSVPRGFLTGPAGVGKSISQQALQTVPVTDPHRTIKAFVTDHSALFGHGAEVFNSARVTREDITPHNGMKTVVWEQQVDGIAVFGSTLLGHVTRNGELVNISSRFLADPVQAADAGMPNRLALQAAPAFAAEQAIVEAAKSIGENLTGGQISALDSPSGPEKRQTFRSAAALSGASMVNLVWVPMTTASMRLCWEVRVASRKRGETYQVLVDAETGDVLSRRCITLYLSDATYRVYTSDSPSPFSPGHPTPLTTQPPVVPRVLVVTAASNIVASPNGWIDDGDRETKGNNVDAHTDWDADDVPDMPRTLGTTNRVFDFPLDLTQAPSNYANAAVVQLFYWCNVYHDWLYDFGFTETAGNYQMTNFNRGGKGRDAVQADAQDGSGFNNANFTPAPDGFAGRVQMYVWDGPTPDRDGDLDAEIILHELTHGLSERLVGGGAGITALQSSGMGEGWSDFYALALLSEPGDAINGNWAAHAYSAIDGGLGYRQNYYYGLRRYPYSTDMQKSPLTFKDIDPAQASSHPGISINPTAGGTVANEVHAMGEIWCVTLWEARANLITKYGFDVGNRQILQLVTDGMKLGPVDPTFLQARDAIIQADLVNNGGANFNELWAAFAKRGMGGSAVAPDSSTTAGLEESYDLPGLAFKSSIVTDAGTGNANGAIDYNECIEIYAIIVNNSRTNATGVTAMLSTMTPGVTVTQPDSPYPNIAPDGTGTNLVAFKIYTSPAFACGTPIQFSLNVQSSVDNRTVKFKVPSGLVGPSLRFNNNSAVAIPDRSSVDSPITVSGIGSAVANITVSLFITHSSDFDLELDLIAPDGTTVALSRFNGGFGANMNYGAACSPDTQRTTFDDKASVSINAGRAPYVGTFKPDESFAAFKGKSGAAVNGIWRLHVIDQYFGGTGSIQCWSLNLSPALCFDGGGDCSTDLGISSSSFTPALPIQGSNLTFTVVATNFGPNTARNVTLFDTLPAGATFVSATTTRGSCSAGSGTVNCNIGSLVSGGGVTVNITVRPNAVGPNTNVATVATTVPDTAPGNNSVVTVVDVRAPGPIVATAGATLVAESFSPATGGIDPGETVTLNFALRNIGSLNTTNLVATLLSSGGVTAPSGPQNYGVLVANGPAKTNQFSFTATGASGGTLTATLLLQDGASNLGTVSYVFGLSGSSSLANQGVINIRDNNTASIYPSQIFVSGLGGLVNKVSVTLSNLSHTFPDDIDVLLVSPSGRSVVLMSDAGSGNSINNVTLTFDDAGVALPDAGAIVTGVYRPTDYEVGDVFSNAPAGPYGSSLSVFNGRDPNGTWSLYVVDDTVGDDGRILNGWRLNISTVDPVNPQADLSVLASGAPNPVGVGGNVTYTLLVSNQGPRTATGVLLTNSLPGSATFVSATPSQGTFTNTGGSQIFNLGTMTNGGGAIVTIVAATTVSGVITDVVRVGGNETDPNTGNSSASVTTTVNPAADLGVSLSASPTPVTLGNNVTYTVLVTNKGPNAASGISLSNTLPAGVTFISATSSQGSCNQSAGRVICSLGALNPTVGASVSIVVRPLSVGTLTNRAQVVALAPADPVAGNNSATLVSSANNPTIVIISGGSRLLAESMIPHTGGIDAGETVTVNLGLRNVGVSNTTALIATLQNSGGVTSPNGPRNYGVVPVGGLTVFQSFTFTASGTNGGAVTATLQLRDEAGNVTNDLGTVTFSFVLGATTTFANFNSIAIPDNGKAVPYPSTITVSNLNGTIGKVTVTLKSITHAYPDDIDVLLVGPSGQSALLMSDAGGANPVNNVTLTFDDEAGVSLPDAQAISPGTYKPSNYSPADSFIAPAPALPYGTTLAGFNGGNPNGDWSLFVADDSFGDLGSMAGGWSLTIRTVGLLNFPPPTLSSPMRQGGTFQFTINGRAGDTYTVQASSDLVTWGDIGSITLGASSGVYVDSNASLSQRFYRASLNP